MLLKSSKNWCRSTTLFVLATFLLVGCGGSGGGTPVSEGDGDPTTAAESLLFATSATVDTPFPEGGIQNFGSGASFDSAYGDDSSYNPVFSVVSGEGYGEDVHVAFLAVTGYEAGFASDFDTFNAKVKGSPDGQIEVKLIGNGADSVVVVDGANHPGSVDLGEGWYELSIPFSEFSNPANISGHTGWILGPPGDQSDETFIFLLTDVGFSGMPFVIEEEELGTTPDHVLYATSATVDTPFPEGGIQNFGSGAQFNAAFDQDATFNPAFSVTSGEGYGEGVHVAFLAVTGYESGFASSFGNFNAKVKGSPDGNIEVKLIGNGDDSVVVVNQASYSGSTDLGEGWYELSIPFSEFSNSANISGHSGWLLGPPGDQADETFIFLLTDVGFSGTATEPPPAGSSPRVLYATSDTIDTPFPEGGIQDFGSGATFNAAFDQDSSYNPAFSVVSGEGYGADVHVAFLAVTGYSVGFAAGYDTFNTKVKGSPDGRIEVKLIGVQDGDSVVEVNVGSYAGSTDLGDGWYQLSIPFSEFSNSANIPNHSGWLLGPPGDQADENFTFLLTDVTFSSSTAAQ